MSGKSCGTAALGCENAENGFTAEGGCATENGFTAEGGCATCLSAGHIANASSAREL